MRKAKVRKVFAAENYRLKPLSEVEQLLRSSKICPPMKR